MRDQFRHHKKLSSGLNDRTQHPSKGIFGMSGSHKSSAVVEAANPAVVERRRPGRIASPPLIPLLRCSIAPAPDFEETREKEVAPARGIVFGVLISGLFWAVLIWIV
jgi:hypothetical protein